MKQCPSCRTTYTDDSLRFCLSDGTPLAEADEQPTRVRPRANDTVRVDLSPGAEVNRTQMTPASPADRKMPTGLKVLIAVVLLGITLVALLGAGGTVFYYVMGGGPSSTPAPTPKPTQSPNIEKKRSPDQTANDRRQADETKTNSNTWNSGIGDESDQPRTATVNSPNDGFLALRSQPDADRGERIAKIPHGAEVDVLRCSSSPTMVSGRSGKWCFVRYDGQTGWAFDAWLEE